MTLSEHIRHFKTITAQGADLLLLRLQILNLDLTEQAGAVLKILPALAVGTVLLSAGLISALFGLNRILPEHLAVWVFFGITAAAALIAVSLAVWSACLWKRHTRRTAATLAEIRNDLAVLRGIKMQPAEKESRHEQP